MKRRPARLILASLLLGTLLTACQMGGVTLGGGYAGGFGGLMASWHSSHHCHVRS